MKREDIVKTANSLKGEEGHQKILEVYNSQKPLPQGYKVKQTDAWCATYVSAVFLMNNYPEFSECSCPRMVEKAKKLGLWVEDDAYVPQIGDVIMYDWQDSGKGDDVGTPDHVGIVVSVSKNKVMVREGNKGKTIGNRDITVNGIYIRGYITPKYDAQNAPNSKESPKTTNNTSVSKKAENKAPAKSQPYIVGKVYTIVVKSSLNVRKGPGKQYACVGYDRLTPDGKKHATSSGALLPNTKVTCQDIKITTSEIWVKIPSGWVCARTDDKIYLV